jgi:hypothetical protein
LRRAIVAGSLVKGRGGQRHRGFGDGSHVSPHVRSNSNATTSVRCLCNPFMSNRDVVPRDSPRSRGKDEPRQGQRPATSGGWLASNREHARRSAGAGLRKGSRQLSTAARSRSVFRVSRLRLAGDEPASSLAAPRFRHHLARGVAGRPSAWCVVRARVTDCEDRQQKAPNGRSVEPASAMSKGARGHIATDR